MISVEDGHPPCILCEKHLDLGYQMVVRIIPTNGQKEGELC